MIHPRGSSLRRILQPFESLLQGPPRIPLLFGEGGLGHGIGAARNIVTVDV